jgi:hypothetical protein
LKEDNLVLNRNYFPGVDLNSFDEEARIQLLRIEDFRVAYEGIVKLPSKQNLGLYAYVYYKNY